MGDLLNHPMLKCSQWDRDWGECGRCLGCQVRSTITALERERDALIEQVSDMRNGIDA